MTLPAGYSRMHQRPLDTPFRRVEEGRFQKGEIDKAGIFGATASFGETFTLNIGSPNSQVMQGERERVEGFKVLSPD